MKKSVSKVIKPAPNTASVVKPDEKSPPEKGEKKLVSLSDLNADPQYQMREKLDEPTVKRYKERYEEDPNQLPPPEAIQKGEELIAVIGFHRLEAAKQAGLKEMWIIIHDGDENDGRWLALGSNSAHGLPLTRGDLKKGVNMALDFFPDKSNVEIARQIGCTEGYIRKIKKEREDSSTNPKEPNEEDEKNEDEQENRTSTISEKEFASLLGKIRGVFPKFSVEQIQLFREEIDALLDANNESDEELEAETEEVIEEEAEDESSDEEDSDDDDADYDDSDWSEDAEEED